MGWQQICRSCVMAANASILLPSGLLIQQMIDPAAAHKQAADDAALLWPISPYRVVVSLSAL